LPEPFDGSFAALFNIGVDSSGDLLIISYANSLVPTTPDSFSPCAAAGNRTFILQLDPSGTARTYASYVPGGLAIRGDGEVWYSDPSGALNSFNIAVRR
jgi:hypothetical protein